MTLALCSGAQAVGALAVPVLERRTRDQRPLAAALVGLSVSDRLSDPVWGTGSGQHSASANRLRALVSTAKAADPCEHVPPDACRSNVHGYGTEEGAPRRLGTGRAYPRTLHDHQESLKKKKSLIGFAGIAWAPTGSMWLWAALLGFGQGIGLAAALSIISLRSHDAQVAARLSGMAQGIGYVIAALGPLAIGVLHDATHGWNVPIVVVLAFAACLAIPGLAAGRNRTIGSPAPESVPALG